MKAERAHLGPVQALPPTQSCSAFPATVRALSVSDLGSFTVSEEVPWQMDPPSGVVAALQRRGDGLRVRVVKIRLDQRVLRNLERLPSVVFRPSDLTAIERSVFPIGFYFVRRATLKERSPIKNLTNLSRC